ncbi:hypothetical protein [Paracoccus sp. (in: a-proteobacteria)]|uniref:hypothetical protein n=1 Tax=Paracoccus sp. TaxID=267 RepID=UPI002AFF7A22|nr:hypothetical protein [Paracoccus sp. (in: a-proteobacteria)]
MPGASPRHGVNFLAAHDGFTLRDLVCYHDKHNEANGEDNRDGHNKNPSWNSGAEGETDDPAGVSARAQARCARAAVHPLPLARLAAHAARRTKWARTQEGNNNAYAQDNDITWLDWEAADGAMVDFVAAINAFRHAHPAITHDHFMSGQERHGVRDVVWLHADGREMNEGDWNDSGASALGMLLRYKDDTVLVWFNRRIEPVVAHLPEGEWSLGIVSDDLGEVSFSERTAVLPPRTVVALVPAG